MSQFQRPPKHPSDPSEATAPFPFPTAEHHDEPPAEKPLPVVETPTEDALDHGIEESFPASDPVSVHVSKVLPAAKPDRGDKGGAR